MSVELIRFWKSLLACACSSILTFSSWLTVRSSSLTDCSSSLLVSSSSAAERSSSLIACSSSLDAFNSSACVSCCSIVARSCVLHAGEFVLQLARRIAGLSGDAGRSAAASAASAGTSSNSTRKKPRAGSSSRSTGRTRRLTRAVRSSSRSVEPAGFDVAALAARPGTARCAVRAAAPGRTAFSSECDGSPPGELQVLPGTSARGARCRAPR